MRTHLDVPNAMLWRLSAQMRLRSRARRCCHAADRGHHRIPVMAAAAAPDEYFPCWHAGVMIFAFLGTTVDDKVSAAVLSSATAVTTAAGCLTRPPPLLLAVPAAGVWTMGQRIGTGHHE